MALKLQICIYMALFSSCLTLLVGLHNSITLTAMLYRTVVSLVFFAIVGYSFGLFAERFLKERLAEIAEKESSIENVSDFSSKVQEEQELAASNFEPLSAKDFENITLTQK